MGAGEGGALSGHRDIPPPQTPDYSVDSLPERGGGLGDSYRLWKTVEWSARTTPETFRARRKRCREDGGRGWDCFSLRRATAGTPAPLLSRVLRRASTCRNGLARGGRRSLPGPQGHLPRVLGDAPRPPAPQFLKPLGTEAECPAAHTVLVSLDAQLPTCAELEEQIAPTKPHGLPHGSPERGWGARTPEGQEDHLMSKTGLKLDPEIEEGLEQVVRNAEDNLGRESEAAGHRAGQPGPAGQCGSREKGASRSPVHR